MALHKRNGLENGAGIARALSREERANSEVRALRKRDFSDSVYRLRNPQKTPPGQMRASTERRFARGQKNKKTKLFV